MCPSRGRKTCPWRQPKRHGVTDRWFSFLFARFAEILQVEKKKGQDGRWLFRYKLSRRRPRKTSFLSNKECQSAYNVLKALTHCYRQDGPFFCSWRDEFVYPPHLSLGWEGWRRHPSSLLFLLGQESEWTAERKATYVSGSGKVRSLGLFFHYHIFRLWLVWLGVKKRGGAHIVVIFPLTTTWESCRCVNYYLATQKKKKRRSVWSHEL